MFDQEFLDSGENSPGDLAKEIDVLPWIDLARHFAFGRLYVVRAPWNLLDAATIIKADNAARVRLAMENGEFGTPTADEAQEWHHTKQEFDVLVLSPFVIASPRI